MRTFDEIKEEIVNKKEDLLPSLTNTSSTSVWNLWADLSASVISIFETIFYNEKEYLITEIENKRYGSLSWLSDKCKEFQYGDSLTFGDDGSIYYDVIDEDKQIVKQASIIENEDGSLLVKVAKETNGEFEPLEDLTELATFTNYIEQIKIAGTVITTLSLNGDVIDGLAQVFYDGVYTEEELKTNLTSSLEAYKNNIGFDGVIIKNDLIQIIRETDGIDDVLFSTLNVTGYGELAEELERTYTTKSGYFNYTNDWLDNWTFTPRY